MHESLLNQLLSSQCGGGGIGQITSFKIELHCCAFEIEAKLISEPPMWDPQPGDYQTPEHERVAYEKWCDQFKYEIISFRKVKL